MAARKVARWLAPLSLVAVIVAVYVVVHKTLAPKHKPTVTTSHVALPVGAKKQDAPAHRRRHVYVVKSGDTLSSIALRNNTSVSTLRSINPRLNPDALQTGQRITLP